MKMYVLVRKDMSKSYQAVQAGHALASYLIEHGQGAWDNTLVYLSVPNEDDLQNWKHTLQTKDIKYTVFKEPDIGNQYTALAVLGNGNLFEGLRLM